MRFSNWQFLVEICGPKEALDWLEEQIPTINDGREADEFDEDEMQDAEMEESEWWCRFSRWSPEVLNAWVDDEEDGDPISLAYAVATMQKKFGITTPWYITWAVAGGSCPRGGAAVCHRGELTQIDTLHWAEDQVEKLSREEAESSDQGDTVREDFMQAQGSDHPAGEPRNPDDEEEGEGSESH